MYCIAVRSTTIRCVGSLLFAVGCDDPKAKIAQLEEELGQTSKDLQATQQDLAQAMQDRDKAAADLALLKQHNADLQAKLNEKPEVPENWTAVPGGAMTSIPGALLFDSGKATLRSSISKSLDEVVATIQERYPGKDIYVFGHTDSRPIRKSGWKDNYALSCQRALEVVRYLARGGLTQGQLVACGWGEHKPAVPNTSAATRQQNRRVEIFAVDPMVASNK